MTARLCATLVAIACAGWASPASAHRLDEYLQATRIGIEADRIVLEIDLTPGANIASQIVARIDADRDGRISDAEEYEYAQRVMGSVALSVNEQRIPVTLLTGQFPAVDDMTRGIGTIRLRAEASLSIGSGRHALTYVNAHAPNDSVYLVNALQPSDDRVHVGAPHRDLLQRRFSIDFDVEPSAVWIRSAAVLVACMVLGALVTGRRRHLLPSVTLVISIAVVSTGLMACATVASKASATSLGRPFTLAPGETRLIEGTGVSVQFERVAEDSRCPADVACIQAGDGVVGISVREQGKPAASYLLHTSRDPRSVVHGNLKIALEALNPKPVSSRAISPKDYQATLRASR